MRMICEDLPAHVAEIVKEWDRFSRAEPRLAGLAEGYRWDSLPLAIQELLKATLCRPDDVEVQRGLITAALKHGEDRRAGAVPPDVVFTEYSVLHDAIWHHLQRLEGPEQRLQSILLVDIGISLATRASLSGYHRQEMEDMGSWAGIVDHLMEEAHLFSRQAG